ncbi:hypothetical protein BGZ95_005380, partial [Linnemannia exigua]
MVNSFMSTKKDDSLFQRIAHRVDGDILTFQAPVEVLDNGDKVVMLQPILDVFPDAAALCRKDRCLVSFLTNQDDVLLVPVRVKYGDGETFFVVPSSGPPPPPPPPSPPQPTPSRQFEQGFTHPSAHSQTHSTEAAVLTIAQETTAVDLPVPRLFIVLPDPRPRDWNNSNAPDSHQPRPYRLYFLCHCGPGSTFPRARSRPRPHTRSARDHSNSNDNNADAIDFDNCIHIADQPGYDIVNLRQFSDRFGEYTLMLLRAFKQGINTVTSSGTSKLPKIILPPLSQRLYPDVLQPFTWDIEERVSTAIATFESLSSQRDNPITNNNSSDTIGVLPTIDLHRLWECVEDLKQVQENKVHSMRRMFVHDGTTRWLCEAHYQSTFGYVQDERDMFLWRCQEILGDEGDLLSELSGPAAAVSAKSNESGLDGDDSTTPQAVAFDYHKMHLRLTGSLDLRQIAQLKIAFKGAYMVQQVTLTMTLPNSLVLMAIADMVSESSVIMWNVSFVAQDDDPAIAQRTFDSKAPSSVPPPYSSHESNTSAQSSPTTTSSSDNSSSNNHNTTIHALHTLFVLGNIKSLRIPDLDAHLYKALAPNPNEFPHIRQFHVWGSNPLGQPNLPGVGAWGAIRPGALLKAFGHLTELRISGVYLGSRKRRPQGDSMPQDGSPTASLFELVESLVYLPHLSLLELSACGLLKENCGALSRSFAVLENRITHLDIHNNWIEDAGLAELLWIVGPRLMSLDARNCGFGNESAFALASILQAHAHEVHQEQSQGYPSQMAIFRTLKLEETEQPHLRLYYDTIFYAFETDKTAPVMARVANQLSVQGRQHLVQALELLQPMELCLSFELGFKDGDFASAFSGMKNLESLEKLQVAYSNFGPLALAAMLRILRATSCRIREIGLQSTLLTIEQQQDAVQQIL